MLDHSLKSITKLASALLLLIPLLGLIEAQTGTGSAWQYGTSQEQDAVIIQRPPYTSRAAQRNREDINDHFNCVSPSGDLFEAFKRQYNRTFDDDSDLRDRFNLFVNTFRRAILFNRVIQNDLTNHSNYELKPSIGNYHFVSPTADTKSLNVSFWFADVTDCELGLIKQIVFRIFHLLDNNFPADAYRVALENSEFLPLLDGQGFEQLANTLLVKLFDRFQADENINQLFQWPNYLKKLAGYAYNRQQAAQENFDAKLAYITYAYPSYFKDLKYNAIAVDRTADNLKAHQEHEQFNKLLGRKFSSRQEKNKRLAIFRQHRTLVNILNEDFRLPNVSLAAEWDSSRAPTTSARLISNRFNTTQFSDLTDAEFVAFLTNDFSLLENSRDSEAFVDSNFKIQPLDEKFRSELAAELELRRGMQRLDLIHHGEPFTDQQVRPTLRLARQVIEELITDVGLPMGSIEDQVSDSDKFQMFKRVAEFYAKSYMQNDQQSDQREERAARLEQFKLNYPKFRAWWIKEGWILHPDQQISVLRLADMSWPEIKFALFKVCCLSENQLSELRSINSTINYWSSNDFMCQPLTGSGQDDLGDVNFGGRARNQRQAGEVQRQLAALELYYYYSVHYNKHQNESPSFNKRFDVFRHNIDGIRRQSCIRSLSLFHSLKHKLSNPVNTIDVLDPKRMYTDDLNLDRYKYFAPANLNVDLRENDVDEGFEYRSSSRESQSPSRAGFSYGFKPLMSQSVSGQLNSPAVNYANRLGSSWQPQKYRQLEARKVYEMVMARYRLCMQLTKRDFNNYQRQTCHSQGKHADQSLSRLSGNLLMREHPEECAMYLNGLERWSEGLISQERLSAQQILLADCNN